MAVLFASAGFWAPCSYKVPGDDLVHVEKKFRVRWKRLDRAARKAINARLEARSELMRIKLGMNSATEAEIEALSKKTITEEEFLVEMVADWELKDARGHDVTYSLQELAATCEQNDGIDEQMFASYFFALTEMNKPKELEKNSDAPSDTTT